MGRGELVIGSELGNAITVTHQSVSRRHAVVRATPVGIELADLNSTNGTFVNNTRVRTPVVLKDRDELRVGIVRFVFLDTRSVKRARSRSLRRLSRRTALELLAVLFLFGFAATDYVLNREAVNRMVRRAYAAARNVREPSTTATPQSAPSAPPSTTTAPDVAERLRRLISRAHKTGPSAPEAASPQPQWLARINYYRAMAKLPPVVEDPALSAGDLKHARYIVENYADVMRVGGALNGASHREDAGRPLYSPEGARAAEDSDMFEGCSRLTDADQVDGWMSGPFHRFPIINPNLRQAGFGTWRHGDCWAAGLDLHLGKVSPSFSPPVAFPPADSIVPAGSFVSGEWPDPTTACPGYAVPVGLPISLEFGGFQDAQMTAHSLSRDGEPQEHCVFDASTYTNPEPQAQALARNILKAYGAVVLIPRAPLQPGANYDVSITARGQNYSWSFKVR